MKLEATRSHLQGRGGEVRNQIDCQRGSTRTRSTKKGFKCPGGNGGKVLTDARNVLPATPKKKAIKKLQEFNGVARRWRRVRKGLSIKGEKSKKGVDKVAFNSSGRCLRIRRNTQGKRHAKKPENKGQRHCVKFTDMVKTDP